MSLSALLGEPELTELQKAFYSGNVKKMKEVCQQFKPKKEQVIFEIIEELTVGKKRIEVDEIAEYDQAFINTALSQHPDLIYYAEHMNSMIGSDRQEYISNQMHFDYLWASIRRGKRARVKWAKSTTSEDKLIIACISELYELSEIKAVEYFREFDSKQIELVKKHSKAFATNEEFLKTKFKQKNLIAEMQSMANKW